MGEISEHVTGIFVRVKRNGRFDTVDMARMTDAELDKYLRNKEPEWVLNCARMLAAWIRDHVAVAPDDVQ